MFAHSLAPLHCLFCGIAQAITSRSTSAAWDREFVPVGEEIVLQDGVNVFAFDQERDIEGQQLPSCLRIPLLSSHPYMMSSFLVRSRCRNAENDDYKLPGNACTGGHRMRCPRQANNRPACCLSADDLPACLDLPACCAATASVMHVAAIHQSNASISSSHQLF
jgi:hypothetical protein